VTEFTDEIARVRSAHAVRDLKSAKREARAVLGQYADGLVWTHHGGDLRATHPDLSEARFYVDSGHLFVVVAGEHHLVTSLADLAPVLPG
jgi:hypothetical protein